MPELDRSISPVRAWGPEPLVVEPTLHGGYHQALLVGAGLVLAAGIGSALLRIRFPHLGEAHHGDRGARRGHAREVTAVPERAV